jgi:hypothetical protein
MEFEYSGDPLRIVKLVKLNIESEKKIGCNATGEGYAKPKGVDDHVAFVLQKGSECNP